MWMTRSESSLEPATRRAAGCALVCAALTLPAAALAQDVGTDITGLNLCLYGDCEARGSYAADPYGWVNPATLPIGTLPYVPRGAFLSGSYFRLNVGDVGADIGSGTLTPALSPYLLQVNAVYAEAEGQLRDLPVDLVFRTRIVRLAAAVDLDRTALRMPGLSAGLLWGIPGTTTDLDASLLRVQLVEAKEERGLDLTGGLHWRGGRRDWFMAGAFLNVLCNPLRTESLDPLTLESVTERSTTNAWFSRFGLSLLPFVGLGLAGSERGLDEWLGEIRLGMDAAYDNISVPAEGTRVRERGLFGVDLRVIPDAWNPVSRFMRFYGISGIDTDGGWGVGLGLYGNGPLTFLSCNPAYSSRKLAPSLGSRVNLWSATCSVAVPF